MGDERPAGAGLPLGVGLVALGVLVAMAAIGWRGLHRLAAAKPPASATARCSFQLGPCEVALDDGTRVFLEVSPYPLRSMSALSFIARVTRKGAPLEGLEAALDLTMPGMVMGPNKVALGREGGGRYQGEGVLVRCPSGGKRWRAQLVATAPDGGVSRASFDFEVDER